MEFTGIKSWAEADRPREKLIHSGAHSLSESELLAILLRTGSRHDTAVDLAKEILRSCDHDLASLSRLTVQELAGFKGVGHAKAVTIIAALELGRRRRSSDALRKKQIRSSRDAAEIMLPYLADLPHEEFFVLLLSRSNEIVRRHQLSKGGVAGTVVDPKVIFKLAVEHLASGLLLFHNHPSGNLKPSAEDIKLTRKIKEAGTLLEIKVLDHIIVAGNKWFSFSDEGML